MASGDDSKHEDYDSLVSETQIPRFGGTSIVNESENKNNTESDMLDTQIDSSDEENEADLLSELRQLSKNFKTKKETKQGNNVSKIERTEESPPQKVSKKEFDEYYKKSVAKFLEKKAEDLEKKRKVKEEIEFKELQKKPNLISKQPNRSRIPLLERIDVIKNQKEREIARLRKAKEEKEEQELKKELTFQPKINPLPNNSSFQSRKEMSPVGQLSARTNRDQSESIDLRESLQKGNSSRSRTRIDSSKNVVDRLYPQSNHINPNNSFRASKKELFSTQTQEQGVPQHQRLGSRSGTEASLKGVNHQVDRDPVIKVAGLAERSDSDNNKNQQQATISKIDKFSENFLASLVEMNEVLRSENKSQANLLQLKDLLELYSQHKMSESQSTTPIIETKPASKESSPSSRLSKAKPITSINEIASQLIKKEPVVINKDNLRSRSQMAKRDQSFQQQENATENSPSRSQITSSSQLNTTTYEESEILNIKQNLMDIQSNLHVLKQSFKHYQTSQPVLEPKLKFVPSPAKEEDPRKVTKPGVVKPSMEQKVATPVKNQIPESAKQEKVVSPELKKIFQNETLSSTKASPEPKKEKETEKPRKEVIQQTQPVQNVRQNSGEKTSQGNLKVIKGSSVQIDSARKEGVPYQNNRVATQGNMAISQTESVMKKTSVKQTVPGNFTQRSESRNVTMSGFEREYASSSLEDSSQPFQEELSFSMKPLNFGVKNEETMLPVAKPGQTLLTKKEETPSRRMISSSTPERKDRFEKPTRPVERTETSEKKSNPSVTPPKREEKVDTSAKKFVMKTPEKTSAKPAYLAKMETSEKKEDLTTTEKGRSERVRTPVKMEEAEKREASEASASKRVVLKTPERKPADSSKKKSVSPYSKRTPKSEASKKQGNGPYDKDPISLFMKPGATMNSKSLKDIAQATLMKFKGYGDQNQGGR